MPRMLVAMTVSLDIRNFLSPFVLHFKQQGWRVDVITRPDEADRANLEIFERVWEANWSRNPLDPRNLLDSPRLIRKIVEQEEYDLVHVHTPVAAFVTRYA